MTNLYDHQLEHCQIYLLRALEDLNNGIFQYLDDVDMYIIQMQPIFTNFGISEFSNIFFLALFITFSNSRGSGMV